MHKYEIIIYWSEDDQAFIAEVPELPGCAAHGQTPDIALSNSHDAIRLWLTRQRNLADPSHPLKAGAFSSPEETVRTSGCSRAGGAAAALRAVPRQRSILACAPMKKSSSGCASRRLPRLQRWFHATSDCRESQGRRRRSGRSCPAESWLTRGLPQLLPSHSQPQRSLAHGSKTRFLADTLPTLGALEPHQQQPALTLALNIINLARRAQRQHDAFLGVNPRGAHGGIFPAWDRPVKKSFQ